MIRLGVNIDHVATLRQARLGLEPDPVAAAMEAVLGGADGITVHLREDRRHIQERDVRILRQMVPCGLNLEMAVSRDIIAFACEILPEEATLVPEKREELTTEGAWMYWLIWRRWKNVWVNSKTAALWFRYSSTPTPDKLKRPIAWEVMPSNFKPRPIPKPRPQRAGPKACRDWWTHPEWRQATAFMSIWAMASTIKMCSRSRQYPKLRNSILATVS